MNMPTQEFMLNVMKEQIEKGEEIMTTIFLVDVDNKLYLVATEAPVQETLGVLIYQVQISKMPPMKAVMVVADTWHSTDTKFLDAHPRARVADDPNRSEALMVAYYRRSHEPDVSIHPYLRGEQTVVWDEDIIRSEDGDTISFGGGMDDMVKELLETRIYG